VAVATEGEKAASVAQAKVRVAVETVEKVAAKAAVAESRACRLAHMVGRAEEVAWGEAAKAVLPGALMEGGEDGPAAAERAASVEDLETVVAAVRVVAMWEVEG